MTDPDNDHEPDFEYGGGSLEPETTPPDLDGLSRDEAIQAIEDWFFENYEDPANSQPYESAEGGYQYIRPGPFDAEEVVREAYEGSVPDGLIDAAVDRIQSGGFDWVPVGSRLREREPDDEPLPNTSAERVEDLEQQLAAAVAAATAALDNVDQLHGRIGHNMPPEGIDEMPLGQNARAALRVDLNDLGGLRARLSVESTSDKELVKRITATATSVGRYVAALADRAAKSIADKAGEIAVQLVAYSTLGDTLLEVVRLARDLIRVFFPGAF